jgi:hypothetical protein
MRLNRVVTTVALVTLVAISAKANAQGYRLEEGWPQLPEGMAWGGVISVDMDADGNIVVFRRAEPPILKFDPSGKLLASMGEGVITRAHGFDIDGEGFLWATDQQGQQIIKFSPDGKVVMTLGQKGVAGDGEDTFSGPCDVTVAANGDIFVADGHGNSRVVKLSKDGKFIKSWGTKGAEPGQFDVPHSSALDSQGRLFIADRSNNRIQIFTQDGEYLESWTQFGSPSGIFISDDDTIYVADSGKGIYVGSAKDGKVTTLIEGTEAEGVTADAAGNVYAAEPGGEILKKFAKQ